MPLDWFPHSVPFTEVSTDTYLRETDVNKLEPPQEEKKTIYTLTYGLPLTKSYIHVSQIICCTVSCQSSFPMPAPHPTPEPKADKELMVKQYAPPPTSQTINPSR